MLLLLQVALRAHARGLAGPRAAVGGGLLCRQRAGGRDDDGADEPDLGAQDEDGLVGSGGQGRVSEHDCRCADDFQD